jgi:competence protein ComEA
MKRKYWILWIVCAAFLFTACSKSYQAVVAGSSPAGLAELPGGSGGSAEGGSSGRFAEGKSSGGTPESGSSGGGRAGAVSADSGSHAARPVPLIWVYVCGAVNQPGVYQLAEGSRVCDALRCAGGLRGDADDRSLNQAQVLGDGQQITVLTAEEAKSGGSVPAGAGTDGSGTPGSGSSGAGSDAKVNINTAGKDELMTLPGVGEARADAIIAYREENGGFKSAEDIMKIEGIKEKSYAKLQDKICV